MISNDAALSHKSTAAFPHLVPAEVGSVAFDWHKSLWLWSNLAVGTAFGVSSASPLTLGFSAALAFLTLCVGHSVGLHRGFIHATYEASPAVRRILAYLFVLSGLGGPLSWAKLHAIRDAFQNQPQCPPYFAYRHSMAKDFIYNLHLRFEPRDERAYHRLPPGLLSDPWLRFLEKTWWIHVALLALLLGILLGPRAAATCVCLRVAGSILGHWAVGYVCHVWGKKPYAIAGAAETGTNVWILGVLSFGEGFHNNHHAHPRSARMGIRRAEFDLGWCMIRVLERLRLVQNVSAWHRSDLPASPIGRSTG